MTTAYAAFSECGTYRFGLLRQWDPSRPPLLFIMLNPSTADHLRNDATVARCQVRAERGPWGGIAVANLFALRSKDPEALRVHADPIGSGNDEAILELASGAGQVVCGWGDDGALGGRSAAVVAMLRASGVQLGYLRLNRSGEPAHPLYVPYRLGWNAWNGAAPAALSKPEKNLHFLQEPMAGAPDCKETAGLCQERPRGRSRSNRNASAGASRAAGSASHEEPRAAAPGAVSAPDGAAPAPAVGQAEGEQVARGGGPTGCASGGCQSFELP